MLSPWVFEFRETLSFLSFCDICGLFVSRAKLILSWLIHLIWEEDRRRSTDRREASPIVSILVHKGQLVKWPFTYKCVSKTFESVKSSFVLCFSVECHFWLAVRISTTNSKVDKCRMSEEKDAFIIHPLFNLTVT